MAPPKTKKEYSKLSQIRQQGIKILGTKLNQEKNIKIVEKYIDKHAQYEAQSNEYELYDSACYDGASYNGASWDRACMSWDIACYDNAYNKIIYQTIGDIIKGIDLKTIVKNIKNGLVLWNHSTFTPIKQLTEEQDEFIINPFEVVEGVTECINEDCRSKRVFTYQVQQRSSDEPMSTKATCVKCKTKWTYSG